MSMNIETYARKPFLVQAIKVTAENMDWIAEWCGGEVLTEKQGRREIRFIKVDVIRPMSEKHSKAYIGEMVLKTNTGFKVYTIKAFEASFEKMAPGPLLDPTGEITRAIMDGKSNEEIVEMIRRERKDVPPPSQPPLFEVVKCGKTEHTIDHKPCVLDKEHGKRPCSSIVLAKMPKGYPEPSFR